MVFLLAPNARSRSRFQIRRTAVSITDKMICMVKTVTEDFLGIVFFIFAHIDGSPWSTAVSDQSRESGDDHDKGAYRHRHR